MSDQSTPDEAYFDRNQAALAFAALAKATGWNVGKGVDPEEPDWPVLFVDTPYGQVSWHLPADEMPDWVPAYGGEWDGHSVEEKRERLAATAKRQSAELSESMKRKVDEMAARDIAAGVHPRQR